jgi:DNA-directed RNA polymerase specialized sigma24 family protein
MLNEQWPRVKQLPEARTTNVVNALLERLEKALQTVDLNDEKHLFNLAYRHLRYILLDRVKDLDDKLARQGVLTVSGKRKGELHTPPALWLRLHEEIDKLPEKQHEIVILIFWWGMSQVEVAHYWDCHVNTVAYHWVRASRALRRALGNDLPSLEKLSKGAAIP